MKNRNYSPSDIFSIMTAILSVIVAVIAIAASFIDISSEMLPNILWKDIIGSFVGVVTGILVTYFAYQFGNRKKRTRIFISYHHEDKSLVGKLSDRLIRNGHLVFDPETMIHPGESISEKIEEGIKNSDLFLILFSKAGLASNWTQKELEFAINHQRKVIPLIAQQNVELPDKLKDTKYLIINEAEFESAMSELLRTVEASS